MFKNTKYALFILFISLAACASSISDYERYEACISVMNGAELNLQVIDSIRRQGAATEAKLDEDLKGIHSILETVEHSIDQVSDDNMRKTLKAQYHDLTTKSGYLTAIIKK